jgi:hypothetical protein
MALRKEKEKVEKVTGDAGNLTTTTSKCPTTLMKLQLRMPYCSTSVSIACFVLDIY